MKGICYQINTQEHFGGGEVYTRFFTRALQRLGWETVLLIHPRADFWRTLDLGTTRLIAVRNGAEILAALPPRDALVISHQGQGAETAAAIRARHRFLGFAHMPLYQRNARPFFDYHGVLPVSQHVLDSLRAAGVETAHDEPLLGVADLKRMRHRTDTPLHARPVFDWDRRKFRDRVLSHLHPWYWKLKPQRPFHQRPGLTLGIVSRLTPIKQFPRLFRHIAPVLADFPQLHLEIFGSGGYASVRDLRQALGPLRQRVRFWGHQNEVTSVYAQLDYLLTGLPELEALGLNVIEAQAAGVPVLAVNAPPFTETVRDGQSGFLYTDPREDGGRDFRTLLERITSLDSPPRPEQAREHLERFSEQAFTQRVERALAKLG
jgi:glycosyltransferase involved in cell wall biosynthesis